MTTDKMISKLRGIGQDMQELRDSMGKRQIQTGAARELSIAIIKVADTLTALGA